MSLRAVVLLSGGMDSTTMLHRMMDDFGECRAIGFMYGQKHSKELDYAWETTRRLKVDFTCVDLCGAIPSGNSALLNPALEIPDGHYADDVMKHTIVPNRNMVMLAIAISHAVAWKFDTVAYAAHKGDHTIYPDCRPEFIGCMQTAAELCDWNKVSLLVPFMLLSKASIVTIGESYQIDWTQTWSCYKGRTQHCGLCGTCVERKEAFYLAGVHDPTFYDE